MGNLSVEDPRQAPANIVWDEGRVAREDRWERIGQRGATIWLTGLSGSGKSTLGAAIEEQLLAAGRWAYRLDGDNLRHGMCSDLGFSRDDRSENVRRVGELAQLFADAGCVALVCLVSPYAADRAHVREAHREQQLDFVEVFVDTSLGECARRDVKGLYARAERGEITDLTGVGAPYERPRAPEITIDEAVDIEAAARMVVAALEPK
jgi:adenylyl-sulfate kinase